MDDQNRTPDTPAEEQAEITFDGQDTGITVKDALGPAAPMIEKIMQEHIARVTETIAALAPTFKAIQERTDESIASLQAFFDSDKWQEMRQKLEEVLELADETEELSPYLEEELKKPEYEGKTIDELLHVAERDEDSTPIEESLYVRALAAARAARDAAAVVAAQQAGRDQRRITREKALASGAIMGLNTGSLITFSNRELWDAFSPERISRIGTLPKDEIDETGLVTRNEFNKGEIEPVKSLEVSYKALFLVNTIIANSVENYRARFVTDGAITFYVKGVLDNLEIDPRIKDDGQLDIDRKTAGALYLEKQFEPLLPLIGTVPGGSRYSVFNYDGYDADTDTMTVRSPYLFQLWTRTQKLYAARKEAQKKRIDEGKKPLKIDLKPLEVNELFKPTVYREDDAVLEIAVYITDVLLAAGKGTHKTEITFKTLIKNCSRLREELKKIDEIPNGALGENGKKINKTARYNSALRKIERAYSLIMNPNKCDALKNFEFTSFVTADKNGKEADRFITPTKSTIDGKISIKWNRINTEE